MDQFTVQIPASVNVWQCSTVWGFGHKCASSPGHLARCTCTCGDEQPPITQCPAAATSYIFRPTE